jgi:RNA polymerase sigma factor (sigma-70 family)
MDDAQLMATYYTDREDESNQAFQVLYLRHKDALVAFLMARCRLRYTDAEDFAEQSFLRVVLTRVRGTGKFDAARGLFKGWLHTIAIRLVASSKRGSKDLHNARPRIQTTISEEDQALFASEPGREDSPQDQAATGELLQAVQDCLRQLPDTQQKVMDSHLQGKSNEVVAQELNVPYGTAGRLLYDARSKMRRCLERKGWPDSQVA